MQEINTQEIKKKYGYIIAGDNISDGVVYTDIKDTSFIGRTGSGIRDIIHAIPIDLNKDNQNDFEFRIRDFGHADYNTIGIEVICLNNNDIASDTSYLGIAHPLVLNLGDTISVNSDFMNIDFQHLSSYSVHIAPPTLPPPHYLEYIDFYWYNKFDKYIGLKLVYAQDTAYGWVRISVPEIASLTIKDFAYRN